MFRTMDNVAVYDKADIDASLGIKPVNKGTAFECIAALENEKADKTQLAQKADKTYAMATRELVADNTAEINILKGKTQNLENNKAEKSALAEKADKSYAIATRELVADNTADINILKGKTQDLENNKVDHSELAQDVSDIVDDIIDSKIALIMSDINTIVANAIGVALQNYDTSIVVDNKIAAATTPMSSAEVIAVVDQYF